METRELSSAQTFLMKFVFPMIWIAGFGAGTLAVWFAHFTGRNGAPPEQMKWLFTAGWLAGTAVILWTCAPLKRVRLVGPVLHISDFRREIVVPLASIDWVYENRWINIHPGRSTLGPRRNSAMRSGSCRRRAYSGFRRIRS